MRKFPKSLALPAVMLQALLLFTCSGCGESSDQPNLETASGRVTLDEQPLEGAQIDFEPTDGKLRGSSAITDSDGRYELTYLRDIKGVVAGAHRVSITKADANDETKQLIPSAYNTETTLTAEVKPDANEFDFDLKSAP